jgi:hypothetical protein
MGRREFIALIGGSTMVWPSRLTRKSASESGRIGILSSFGAKVLGRPRWREAIMRRRDFISLAVSAAIVGPRPTHAQSSSKTYRVGPLTPLNE